MRIRRIAAVIVALLVFQPFTIGEASADEVIQYEMVGACGPPTIELTVSDGVGSASVRIDGLGNTVEPELELDGLVVQGPLFEAWQPERFQVEWPPFMAVGELAGLPFSIELNEARVSCGPFFFTNLWDAKATTQLSGTFLFDGSSLPFAITQSGVNASECSMKDPVFPDGGFDRLVTTSNESGIRFRVRLDTEPVPIAQDGPLEFGLNPSGRLPLCEFTRLPEPSAIASTVAATAAVLFLSGLRRRSRTRGLTCSENPQPLTSTVFRVKSATVGLTKDADETLGRSK